LGRKLPDQKLYFLDRHTIRLWVCPHRRIFYCVLLCDVV
jgi:hypothetical protein